MAPGPGIREALCWGAGAAAMLWLQERAANPRASVEVDLVTKRSATRYCWPLGLPWLAVGGRVLQRAGGRRPRLMGLCSQLRKRWSCRPFPIIHYICNVLLSACM